MDGMRIRMGYDNMDRMSLWIRDEYTAGMSKWMWWEYGWDENMDGIRIYLGYDNYGWDEYGLENYLDGMSSVHVKLWK